MTYWNAFVANLEMHGQGTFYDPRLDNAEQFPIAAENRFGHTKAPVDLISPKLPALQAYQLALAAPKPPKGTFDAAAAARGKKLFMGQAECSTCHVPPTVHRAGVQHAPRRRDRHRQLPGRPVARRTCTGPVRWPVCGATRRAASTTTAGSPT